MAEKLLPRLYKHAKLLGLPNDAYARLSEAEDNWVEIFKSYGARSWDERYRVHDQDDPNLKTLPLMAPGSEVALVAKRPDGKYVVLVQVRNNGEENDKDKEVGLPGGATNLWQYQDEIVPEHYVLTAYREFYEETGIPLKGEIEVFCLSCRTVHYDRFPDAYGYSVYFICKVDYSEMQKFENCTANIEGRMMVIPVENLPKYKWFGDAEEAFELLQEKFSNTKLS